MLTDTMKQELKEIGVQLLWEEPMARHTTIRIGGPADLLAYPKTLDEITELIRWARRNRLPLFVLGAGSNLLVRDKGVRGVVISLTNGFTAVRLEGTTILFAESGVGIPRLVDYAAEQGLAGIEPLAGIPGNLGGALVMNAGTPEGEIGPVVLTVTFIDREGKLVTWQRDQIKFGYRETHFPKGSILLSARLQLTPSSPELVKEKVAKARARRIQTQPLNVPNLGSVFKNPKKGFAGHYIEELGLKDVRVGGARVSPKHGNFIVNEGNATARDVLALIGLIRDKVKEKFGVSLEMEAQVIGEE